MVHTYLDVSTSKKKIKKFHVSCQLCNNRKIEHGCHDAKRDYHVYLSVGTFVAK